MDITITSVRLSSDVLYRSKKRYRSIFTVFLVSQSLIHVDNYIFCFGTKMINLMFMKKCPTIIWNYLKNYINYLTILNNNYSLYQHFCVYTFNVSIAVVLFPRTNGDSGVNSWVFRSTIKDLTSRLIDICIARGGRPSFM